MHDTLMLLSERPPIYASSCMTISGGRTEQHAVIGFGELAAIVLIYVLYSIDQLVYVDIRLVY